MFFLFPNSFRVMHQDTHWVFKVHGINDLTVGKKSTFLILDENKTYQSLFLFLFFFVSFQTSSSQLDFFFMILRRNYLVDVNKGN